MLAKNERGLPMKKKIEFTEDGRVKDFSVPSAHHLYVTAFSTATGKVLRKEAIALWSIEELDTLLSTIDKEDGLIVGHKWAINDDVIKALKENGDCFQDIPGFPMRFHYVLKPMKYADNLKHRG